MKSPFKTILISSLVTLSALISIVYTSCKNDKCNGIVCAYGGVCNQGSCNCLPGFEGTNCETISADKFKSSWQVSETGSTTVTTEYLIDIKESTPITNVVINNFFNYFTTPITAYVNHDTLTIPNQALEGKVIFGVGYIYSSNTSSISGQYDAISMSYEVIDTATGRVDDFGYYPDGSNPSQWSKTH